MLSNRLLLLVCAAPGSAAVAVEDAHGHKEAHDNDAQREEDVRKVLGRSEPPAWWLRVLQQRPLAATLRY